MSIWISIASIIIAVITLIITLKRFSYDRTLQGAQKRTELLAKVGTMIEEAKKVLHGFESMDPQLTFCKDAHPRLLSLAKAQVANFQALYVSIEQDASAAAVSLERFHPAVVQMAKGGEEVQRTANQVLKNCEDCPVLKKPAGRIVVE